MMSDRTLLATTTGEPFQPARLHYFVLDCPKLEACFRKLRCMSFDKGRNGWVWLYDDEARSLKFQQSWRDVSKHGPTVLGTFYIRSGRAAELYVRSIERAVMAVAFFDEHVPHDVARITDMDVVNRLFSGVERELTPESLFAPAEADLRQQFVKREALCANPMQMLADFHRQYSGQERKQLPEIERIPTNFYEDGIQLLASTLRLRQYLALEHWTGNHDLTLFDLIQRAVTGNIGPAAPGSPESQDIARINWDFAPTVPVRDFFKSLEQSGQFNLDEAVENFIYNMKKDSFRTWEAVIREEQGRATMLVLTDLAEEQIGFASDEDHLVHYIDGIERCNEPWYEILRRIAPHLLIERLRTAGVYDEVLLEGWPRIAAWVQRRARGLSLPAGVGQPLDVVPAEIRHRLWLQSCCEPLIGLGQGKEITLSDKEELWRVDRLLDLLSRHRDSVEFLGLTLDGFLDLCELPNPDRPIFIRLVSDRLGLSGTDELLSPKLEPNSRWPDEPGEPIERLSDDDIRQAIQHPEPAVFRAAIRYFAGLRSRDPSIAPLIIDSIHKMTDNRDRMFAWACLSQFAQTDETAERILQELYALLSLDQVSELDCFTVTLPLLEASESFLVSNKRDILATMSAIDPQLYADVKARISDFSLTGDSRWDIFVELVQPGKVDIDLDDFYPRGEFVERMQCLIRGMGDDERPVRWVMETLRRTINDQDYDCGCELIAVSLCGVLRLEEAIPYLIAQLHDEDGEMVEYACRSLSSIGGDAVIEALDRCFFDAGQYFQLQAATVLQYIHSDHSIRTLEKWSRDAEDESSQCRARQAMLERFVTSEIDRSRQWIIDAKPTCEEAVKLRRALVAASLIAGRNFDELDDWLVTVREDLATELSMEDSWDEDEDEDLSENSGMSGAPLPRSGSWRVANLPEPFRDESPMFETRATPVINSGRKVGRNDPCLCGSGKKYKKCCLNKQ